MGAQNNFKLLPKNNIFVLDLDTQKWTSEECESFRNNNNIHPFIQEFGDDFITAFDTLSVQTKSGGEQLEGVPCAFLFQTFGGAPLPKSPPRHLLD